jgi:hypothetical protein
VTPKLRFFAGPDGVKQLMKDLMWHDKTTLQIIWPEKKMNQVFDRLFLEWFDDRRKIRQLTIQSLWVSSVKKVADNLFRTGVKDTQRRLDLEKLITMATIIYDTKVAFISSSAEAFGFIVESTEFAQSEREKFVSLWSNAK